MHIGSGKKPWSYIKPPDWWKYENSKINPTLLMIDVSSILWN